MSAFDFKVDNSVLKAKLNKLAAVKHAVMPDVFKFFVAHTPIRSGNARSHTVLQNDTIVAAYPYATELDAGRSKQQPMGMVKPTIKEAQRLTTAWIQKNGK